MTLLCESGETEMTLQWKSKLTNRIINDYFIYLIKIIGIVVFISLIILLLVKENSTAIVWTMVLPVIPVLFLILGFSNWRNACPLAFFSKLSQNLNWLQKRKVPKWFENNFYYFQYFLLFVAFNARLVTLNFDDLYLAFFFIFVIIGAFSINLVYTGKSWCNFFCPVGVVEKIYCTSNSHKHEINSACSKCSACKKNCPDIDMESNYWKESVNKQKTFVFYSFSGLVLGFYLYFYFQSGSLSYFFSGAWTKENISMFSSGFFFAPFIPVIVAAPITLGFFTLGSFYLFKYIEIFFWKNKIVKNIAYTTLLHRVKVSAAFVAFNIFYIFAGAPAYNAYPLLYGLFHFMVIVISAIALHKEFFREESYFIQERFAIKMIKRWNSDKPIPNNLKEIYYTYSNEKKNKEEKLQMYKGSLSDLLNEGILTEESMVILEKLREQMGISRKDHLDTIRSIKLNNEDLFDANIEKSAERKYQKNNYKKMIEDTLSEHLEIDLTLLHTLQKQFHISNEDHADIIEDILNSNKKLENNVIEMIQEMKYLSTTHASYFDDNSLETNFLKFSLRDRFNIVSKELFNILKVMYENHEEELKPLREIFKYKRGELLIQCKENMSSFMSETIVSEIIKLISAIDTYQEMVEESYNIVFLKEIMQNSCVELATVGLFNLKKYDKLLYGSISYDRFESSGDRDIVDVYKKIVFSNTDMTLYDKMMYLYSIPFFANITFSDLHYLAYAAVIVNFNEKETIIEQGSTGDSLFILAEGEVEVEVDGKKISRLSRGNYFGEIAIIADVKRIATVKSVTNIMTLKLSVKNFKEFILEHPQVSIGLIKEITLRLLDSKN